MSKEYAAAADLPADEEQEDSTVVTSSPLNDDGALKLARPREGSEADDGVAAPKRARPCMLGPTWQLAGPELLVTDPSYKKGTWCTVRVADALPGAWRWRAAAHDWERVGARLVTWHSEHSTDALDLEWWPAMGRQGLGRSKPRKDRPMFAGLDTAQVGVFDAALYPDGNTGDYDDPASFYGGCCSVSSHGGGVMPALPASPSLSDSGILLKATSDGQINVFVARSHIASGQDVVVGVRLGEDDPDAPPPPDRE